MLIGLFTTSTTAATRCPAARVDERAHVAYVYDGDTIRLNDGRSIRLIGINTPELAHQQRAHQQQAHPKKGRHRQALKSDEPLARAARAAVIKLLAHSNLVGLQYGPDRHDHYHRTLAHVFLADGSSLELKLLAAGLASVIAIPPNIQRIDCYQRAEQAARRRGKGLWSDPFYRPIPASKVTKKIRGYHFVHGTIQHIGKSRKSLWLDFDGGFSVRIPRRSLHYFQDQDPRQWLHHQVTVRGWITTYRKEAMMQIRHPAAITIGH